MPKQLTEVEKLQRKIERIQKECKHPRLYIIKGTLINDIFAVECQVCSILFNLSAKEHCCRCLGRMELATATSYKCIRCGHCFSETLR